MSNTFELIQETINKLTSLEKAKMHYDHLTSSIKEDKNRLQDLADQVEKEAQDVEKLEKMSVTSLFLKVLGNKEEQIEKERQEYLEAALKFKELKSTIELAEYEYQVVSVKVAELDATRNSLVKLKKIREEEIIQRNEPAKAQILGLLNEMDKIARLKEEIVQGHNAGKNALQYLDQVAFHLKEAIKWGDWDMTSNNRYYDHMKHNSLDTAIDNAYKAKHALTIFNNELADVGYNNNSFGLNVEAFTKFSDVFFDNLISDWIVQSKIKNVYSHVDMVKDKVLRMVQTLESDFDQAKLKFESLVKHKDELLINR